MNHSEKLEVYRKAADLLRENGYEADVRDDYSGRAMYGKSCPAIVTDAPAVLIGFVICEAICDEDFGPIDLDPIEVLPQRTDSMGLSSVCY